MTRKPKCDPLAELRKWAKDEEEFLSARRSRWIHPQDSRAYARDCASMGIIIRVIEEIDRIRRRIKRGRAKK